MLQVICINNLSILYKKNQKYKKSLENSLIGISMITSHLYDLFVTKNKAKIVENGIIYVNLLSTAQSCLK